MTDYTPILHLPEVAPNQNQKEATINTALAILESAMNDVKPYTLASSGAYALTEDDYTRYFLHRFDGQTLAYEISVPAGSPRWFAVENDGDFPVTIKCQGVTGGLTLEVPSAKIALAVSDGTNVRTVVPQDAMGLLQDLSDVAGVPTDGQLLRYDAPTQMWRPWTLSMAFKALSDVPHSYSTMGGKLVAVKSDESGLEFVTSAANVNDFLDLTDTPGTYSGSGGFTVKVSNGASGLIFARPTFLEASDTPSTYGGAANKFVRVDPTANMLIFDVPDFLDLGDTPSAYTGQENKFVKVNAAGTGLEFNTGSGGPDSFITLTDTPNAYTGQAGKFARVKTDETGLEFALATFLSLTDTPASYASQGNKIVAVNAGGTALVFRDFRIQDLSNVSASPVANKWLRWNGAGDLIVYDTPSFLGLADTPKSYAGHGGKYVYVKGDESGLGFTTTPISISYLELNDTDDTTYVGATGFVPTVTIVSGTPVLKLTKQSFANLDGLNIVSPTDGQIIGYDADTGTWGNIDAPEGGGGGSIGVPSYGEHAYWRLLLHTTDGSTSQYGIQEIQFKHTKTGSDLANGGTASASSDQFGTVSGAFDNVISGAWFSDTPNDGEWIAYHFTSPADVRYLTLQGSQSQPDTSPRSFSVQYSDDGVAYTTAWEVTGQNGWAPGQIREFHAPIDLFFTDLADAPPTYIGQGLKVLRANAGETALEFFSLPSIPTKLDDLTDVQVTGTPTDGQVLAWDDATGVFKPTSVPGVTPTAFVDLIDAPSSYTGEGGNAVRVKMTEDGLEFYTPGTGGGGGGGWRGAWAAGAEQVFITFDDGALNPALTYDAAGFTVVSQPDSVAGTNFALKFRPIGNGASCYCELPIEDVVNAANLKVRYKVSSESPDYFRVLQDGSQVLQDSGVAGIYEEFSLATTGDHTLRFTYSKDGSLAVGDDTVYISQITYFKTLSNPYVYGDTVTYQGSYWLCRQAGTSEAPGAGDDWIKLPEYLANLKDVDLSTPPTNGQALIYDGTSNKFKPGTVESGSGGGGNKYNIGVTPRTRLHRVAVQSIPTSTWTAVQWDTESEDAVNAFVSGSNTRITIPVGVKSARVTAYANWVNPVTTSVVGVALRRNGVEIGSTGGSPIVASRAGLYQSHLNFTSEWFPVTAGDYYEVFVYHDSGSNRDLNGPVTNYGENTYVQFEWDEGMSVTAVEAGDFHGPHQGWRMLTIDSQTGTYATFGELKFFDRSGVQIATTGGKLFDTYSHPSYPVQQAFDGNNTTYWSSLQQTSTGQLAGPGYIFAAPVDVGSIKLTSTSTDFNTTNSPKNFVIQYTDDGGASWLTYAMFTNQTAWGDREERTFVLPTSGVARVGGARSLDELKDVTIGTPKHGDLLTYDAGTSTWKQKTRWGYAPPKATDFSVALGTVALTLTDDDDVGLMIDCGESTFGDVQRMRLKSLPGGDWAVTVKIVEHLIPFNYNGVGLMLRESSTGKLAMFGVESVTDSGTGASQVLRKLRYSRLPGLTGFTSNPYSEFSPSGIQWYRLTLVGSVIRAFVSADGKMWRQVYLESTGGSFTSGPDQIGFGCSLNANYALNPTFSVPYWSQSW